MLRIDRVSSVARRFLLWLLLLGSGLALIFFYLLDFAEQQRERRLLIEANHLSERQQQQIGIDFMEIRSDLLFLASDPLWRDVAVPQPDPASLRVLKERLLAYCRNKGRYDQIRYLDAQGMERLRVNFNDGRPMAVPVGQLQSKAHRYYFTEAIGIEPGRIYQSPLDLNVEHKQVEVPLKPMIRFATPVTLGAGDTSGIIVLNYFGSYFLREFRNAAKGFPGRSALLNNDGDFLAGFRREQEWGFMFDRASPDSFPNMYPGVWQTMQEEGFGVRRTADGIFAFFEMEVGQGTVPSRRWHIVQWLPSVFLHAQRQRSMTALLPVFTLIALLLAPILWLLLWNAERRRQSEMVGRQLRADIRSERDAFVGGPTVVVKYQNRFGWPVDYVSPNIGQLLSLQAQDFTTGRITYSSVIAPEFLHRFTEENRQAVRHGNSGFERSQYQLVDGTGQRRWLQDYTSLVRDQAGNATHFIGYINDITPLKKVQEALIEAKEYARQLLDSIADPTLVIEPGTYRLELINRAARMVYVKDGRADVPQTCHELSHNSDHPCNGSDDPCPIALIRETGKPQNVIHRRFNSQGEPFYVEVSATPVLDADGHLLRIIESHRDITRHEEMKRQLRHLAETDQLTGAYNRVRLHKELKLSTQQARRLEIPMALIMFDLDRFKQINDRYGHDAGDAVLRRVCERVRSAIRHQDLLARWGGEEFLILLADTSLHDAEKVAENLRSLVAGRPVEPVGPVTASFGVVSFTPGDTEESLIKRVDAALYESKRNGRNRTTSLSP